MSRWRSGSLTTFKRIEHDATSDQRCIRVQELSYSNSRFAVLASAAPRAYSRRAPCRRAGAADRPTRASARPGAPSAGAAEAACRRRRAPPPQTSAMIASVDEGRGGQDRRRTGRPRRRRRAARPRRRRARASTAPMQDRQHAPDDEQDAEEVGRENGARRGLYGRADPRDRTRLGRRRRTRTGAVAACGSSRGSGAARRRDARPAPTGARGAGTSASPVPRHAPQARPRLAAAAAGGHVRRDRAPRAGRARPSTRRAARRHFGRERRRGLRASGARRPARETRRAPARRDARPTGSRSRSRRRSTRADLGGADESRSRVALGSEAIRLTSIIEPQR